MAHAPSSTALAPVTEQAFEADRVKMWALFCKMTVVAVVATILSLALMGLLLF